MVVKHLSWAFDHRVTRNAKYESHAHPIFAIVAGNTFFMLSVKFIEIVMTIIHPEVFPVKTPLAPYSMFIGAFLLFYLFVMISTRYIENGALALYQSLWACNECMLLVSYGIFTHNPYLIGGAVITVCVDQVLWYFDCLGYLILKKFPIGVAKYLIWPQTSSLRKATSTHHLWFIPLMFYVLKDSGVRIGAIEFQVSCFVVVTLGIMGRSLAPRRVDLPNDKHVYMNLNLSWELWKDVPLKFLDVLKTVPFYVALMSLASLWIAANCVFYYPVKFLQTTFA